MRRCDVLVVGAGPAGAAAAAALGRDGRDVVLLEASRHPRPKACAEYASPRILEELRRIGLADEDWLGDARPLRGMRVIRGATAVDLSYADRRGSRSAWGVDRQRLDGAIARHAATSGAELLERTALDALRPDGNGGWVATARTAAGEVSIGARRVIGADGARSRVARLLGVERPVRRPRRLGLVAHFDAIPDLGDGGEMHVGPAHYIGLAPMSGGRVNVGMALPTDGRTASARRRFEDAIAALPAVAERLAGRRRLTPIRGAMPIGHRVRAAAGPGWMLVGDAAGFVDPFTGEGIYRALRSARAAVEALAVGDVGAEARYVAARRAAFAAKDLVTWTIQGMLAVPPALGYALRRLERRPELAARLGAALGDCRPAADALSPAFLARVLRP